MKVGVLTLALLSAVAGLAMAQTPSTPPAMPPSAPPSAAPREEGQPPGPEVRYVCPGGTDFSAHFSKDGDLATLMVAGHPEIELPRQRSGSGFAYGDSYYELRGRGREATLTAAGRSMRCHAAGRPGDPPRTFAGAGLTVTLLPDGTFRLRESDADVRFHRVETPGYPLFREPQYLLALANRLVQVARAYHLDIIHAHYAIPHAAAAYLAFGEGRAEMLPGSDFLEDLNSSPPVPPVVAGLIDATCRFCQPPF